MGRFKINHNCLIQNALHAAKGNTDKDRDSKHNENEREKLTEFGAKELASKT